MDDQTIQLKVYSKVINFLAQVIENRARCKRDMKLIKLGDPRLEYIAQGRTQAYNEIMTLAKNIFPELREVLRNSEVENENG